MKSLVAFKEKLSGQRRKTMEALVKLLELLNGKFVGGVLSGKDVIETVQEVIDYFRNKNEGLEAQVCTLMDDAIRSFASEFKLEYDDKWLWKILNHREDMLYKLDEILHDKEILKYVFNKDISPDEMKVWRYSLLVRLSDEDMDRVRNFLNCQREDAKYMSAESQNEQPFLFTLAAPLPPEKEYIERDEEEKILNMLRTKKKLVLVNGLGGVGKSAVCKKIFQNLRAQGKVRLGWVTYNGKNLERDFVAQFKYPKEKREENLTYFLQERIDPDAIIFVDNFNSIEKDDPYIQQLQSVRCNLICTSRITEFNWFERVPIDLFNVEKCIALFKKYAQISEEEKKDDNTIAAIAGRVGRHTLTIEILGKICYAEDRQPSDILKELEAKGIDVSGTAEVELKESTLVEHLIRIFPVEKLNEEQKYILYHFAICPLEHTPGDILEWIDIKKRAAVKLLERYGWFVHEAKSKTYYMHPIIREVVVRVCKPEKEWFDTLIQNIAKVTRYDRNLGSAQKELYSSYLKKIINLTVQWEIVNADVAQLYFNLSVLEQFRKNYNGAIDLLKKELELWDKIRNRSLEKELMINTRIANVKVQIGANYYYIGELAMALKWYEDVNQMKGTYADKELEEQMGNNCGLVYQAQASALLKEGKNADDLLKKASDGFKSTIKAYLNMGKKDLNVAIGYRNFAACRYKMKHYEEAVKAFEQSRSIAEDVIKDKENSPDLERIYGQLAYAYDAWGDSLSEKNQKEEKYRQALKYYEKCHNSCHVNYYKGISWIKLGELEEKWEVCRKKVCD